MVMKYIWPVPVGTVLLVSVYFALQYLGHYVFIYTLVILVLMPVIVVIIQGREGRFFSFVGLVFGAICGLVVGYYVGPFISELIHGEISVKYNIRIDLVIWWAIFASFFASIFSAVGGKLGRIQAYKSPVINDVQAVEKLKYLSFFKK